MKIKCVLPLGVLFLITTSCVFAQDVIKPGESIGPVKIGTEVSTSDLKAYRDRLTKMGLIITMEKGATISSVSTGNPKYTLNGSIQVGMAVSDLLNLLGAPELVDGGPSTGGDLAGTKRGFFAYDGLVIGINEGKIAFITVVPRK